MTRPDGQAAGAEPAATPDDPAVAADALSEEEAAAGAPSDDDVVDAEIVDEEGRA